MRLKGRREAHNAEVVERGLFATRKSLKSLAAEKPFSPFSNLRAGPRNYVRRSIPDSARRTSTYPPPAISSFGRFRTPVAGVRGVARARPASENVHNSGHPTYYTATAPGGHPRDGTYKKGYAVR